MRTVDSDLGHENSVEVSGVRVWALDCVVCVGKAPSEALGLFLFFFLAVWDLNSGLLAC
jgi:hypothetical protein